MAGVQLYNIWPFFRPFLRLDGANEVERLDGWEDLETGDFYSQGNWKDLNEFFEYCTEWEPTNSLYFGGERNKTGTIDE